jgi:hypothetical protein
MRTWRRLGTGSGTEGVEALPESAFQLVGSHSHRWLLATSVNRI